MRRLIALAMLMLPFSATGEQSVFEAAQAEAVKNYPELAIQGSSFHLRFMEELQKARTTKDSILNRADWPLRIAEKVSASGKLIFPPGATLAEKKQLIREHLQEAQRTSMIVQTQANLAQSEQARKNSEQDVVRGMQRTIKEVESDLPSFLDKPIVLVGKIDVSSYYNYAFAKAQDVYYSFTLFDGSGTAHLYMKKNAAAAALRRAILDGGRQSVTCKIGVSSILYERESSIHAYLVDYRISPANKDYRDE